MDPRAPEKLDPTKHRELLIEFAIAAIWIVGLCVVIAWAIRLAWR
ncbi:MAG TPA: hypothetical protein VFV74_00210 [Burkholderiales bacterium]|nr:hypothetical protein [Burkholderiales bacterium]